MRAVYLLVALWMPFAAFAARPFVTDDARIVDPGGYQVEAYVKDQRGQRHTEYWVLPGVNFGGALDRFEFTFGGNYTAVQEGGNSNLIVGQVKTLLKPLEPNGLGFAFTLGVSRVNPGADEVFLSSPFDIATPDDTATSNRVQYNPFLNAISSVSILDDRAVFHFNLGVTRDNVDKTTLGNWGAGAEIGVTERVFGIAEVYGLTEGKPAYQFGVRYWAIPKYLQVDATGGLQRASPANLRWISIGVRILW